MTILVNDEPFDLEREMTVAEFIAEELEAEGEFVILVNDTVVPVEKRASVILKEGDSVEAVRFVSGG
ncbi:MAG: sulfur carrier protein ThiS [Spirochaetia bacterium]|nr:sulfur carrier protein ThiS [Spirochaetia bacterium]